MKLCRDCVFFEPLRQDCIHPANCRPSVIDGAVVPNNSIMFLRGKLNNEDCGLEGRWWEQK